MRKFTFALAAFLAPVLLSAPVYATGPDGSERPGGSFAGLRQFGSGFDDLVDIMGQVWVVMISNPVLLVFLAGSLFALGVRIFKKVKGSAKG